MLEQSIIEQLSLSMPNEEKQGHVPENRRMSMFHFSFSKGDADFAKEGSLIIIIRAKNLFKQLEWQR